MQTSEKQTPIRARVLVVGAGAVSGFYGGKLAQAGASVSVVSRSDCEHIAAHGIEVTSVWGDFHCMPEQVVKSSADYGGGADYLLVALKVLPEIDAGALIAPAVGPQTAIVLIQNGVDIERHFQLCFPATEIISGLAFVCVTCTGPGRIHHQECGRLVLGRYPGGASPTAVDLARLFGSADAPCRVTETVVTARWGKLVWNAPFNLISVLGGCIATRGMLAVPEAAHLVRSVMEEVKAVAAAAGHPLDPRVIDKDLRETESMPPYRTSMLVDYEMKRPMEVEAILGQAEHAAQRLRVRVAHLESLHALLPLADRENRLANAAP
jgi:2-dehydropantoate 2-reductase